MVGVRFRVKVRNEVKQFSRFSSRASQGEMSGTKCPVPNRAVRGQHGNGNCVVRGRNGVKSLSPRNYQCSVPAWSADIVLATGVDVCC